jgi:hypothetical protein
VTVVELSSPEVQTHPNHETPGIDEHGVQGTRRQKTTKKPIETCLAICALIRYA